MRCKKHPDDVSGGICASCLRERLFAVMAAQAQKEAQLDRRKSDTQRPLPLSFPRSVSPYYVSGRKSTNSATWQQFHSTPHVGPNGAVTVEVGKKKDKEKEKEEKKKSNAGRFSKMFLGLFRSKKDRPDSDSGPGSDEYSCTASPPWFSTVIPGRRRRKQIRTFSLDEGAIAAQRKACQNRDRGMSPARFSDDDEHCAGAGGYSSDSSPAWKQTPWMTPATARRAGGKGAGHSRNVSGLAFCLSPLVRASPTRHWNQIGLPPEMPMAVGESRAQPKPKAHLSAATSFCKNRSRKLTDFGRYH